MQKRKMVISTFDIGDHVECDLCRRDYTHSDAIGGLLFLSKGICPECAPKLLADAKLYNEEHAIRARANPGEKFRDFILRVRNGYNTVCSITVE